MKSKHRQQLEERSLDADIEAQKTLLNQLKTGQIFGFILGAITVIAGAWTAINGAEWAGGAIGTTGVIGIVTAFLYQRKSESKNIQSSREQVSD